MEGYKVLIADDEKDILEIMAKKVEAAGFGVTLARDGDQAWEKIKSESPDIILLDLLMPKMDGFSVLAKLRETPPSGKWQPVIIISAKGELADMQKGFSLQADQNGSDSPYQVPRKHIADHPRLLSRQTRFAGNPVWDLIGSSDKSDRRRAVTDP